MAEQRDWPAQSLRICRTTFLVSFLCSLLTGSDQAKLNWNRWPGEVSSRLRAGAYHSGEQAGVRSNPEIRLDLIVRLWA